MAPEWISQRETFRANKNLISSKIFGRKLQRLALERQASSKSKIAFRFGPKFTFYYERSSMSHFDETNASSRTKSEFITSNELNWTDALAPECAEKSYGIRTLALGFITIHWMSQKTFTEVIYLIYCCEPFLHPFLQGPSLHGFGPLKKQKKWHWRISEGRLTKIPDNDFFIWVIILQKKEIFANLLLKSVFNPFLH